MLDHPLYKASKLASVPQDGAFGIMPWSLIEANIRAGREPMTGLAGLSGPSSASGPGATEDEVSRLVEKVKRQGGRVERVPRDDPRLPSRVEGRTYLERGRPVVILAEGTVKTATVTSELLHAPQLRRAVAEQGSTSVNRILEKPWTAKAQCQIAAWELEASRAVTPPARDFPRGGAADATAATRGILERLVEERSRVPEREGR